MKITLPKHPIRDMTRQEKLLWLGSAGAVLLANLCSGAPDGLTLCAALVGVTSLVLAAGGNVWSQILMILFSILYGAISFRFRYWGEMITYLGMTLPMAVWSTYTWMKHPSRDNGAQVAIQPLGTRHVWGLALSSCGVTGLFYFILRWLGTPNLGFSTLSVLTSFLAAALTMLRSSYYALAYGANDLVLIVLWVMATREDPAYLPVAVNFTLFFVNDLYGFFRWKQRERRETGAPAR